MIGVILANVLNSVGSNVVVPEATEQAMSFYHSGNILWIVQWAWSLIIPLLFLVTGFSGKLGAFAEKYGKKWFFSILIYLAIFVSLYQLLNLPLEFYASYLREHEYGLSTQTLGRWLDNYIKWTMVILFSAWAFVWIFYLLLKKSPHRWWLYSSVLSIGIAFLMMFIQPIWIDPLFNQFESMKDKQLEKRILALASQTGIEHGRVFEVDKSKDTKTGNAYVAGLGDTKRIVIWDTSIKGNSTEGILFLMGHEMGHYVLSHGWLFMGYFAILTFAISYLTYRIAHTVLVRFHRRWGFKHLYEIASFPLILFLISFFILLSTPVFNYFSRYMEREADRFGLEITQNNEAAAGLFANAMHDHLANPRPGIIYKIWRGHHPSPGERADFCNSYCPWKKGEPLQYDKYFNRNLE
jgi:STE24 endopeptidase